MKTWAHDELAEDLASHLVGPRRMIWINMQLGPAGSPRPDVYTLDKSFVRPNPTAYECKISVPDFRADATTAKWHTYLDYAHSVVFAVPAGLISTKDVPEQCGLIIRHENAWRVAKKAMPSPRLIAQEALIKLLIDGIDREGPKRRARRWNNEQTLREFARKFGRTAARYVADAASVEHDYEVAQEKRDQIIKGAHHDAERLRKEAVDALPLEWKSLLSVLDLVPGSDEWAVKDAIADLKRANDGGEEAIALKQILTTLHRLVNMNSHFIKLDNPKFIDIPRACSERVGK